MSVNKFAGQCDVCHSTVPANGGTLHRHGRRQALDALKGRCADKDLPALWPVWNGDAGVFLEGVAAVEIDAPKVRYLPQTPEPVRHPVAQPAVQADPLPHRNTKALWRIDLVDGKPVEERVGTAFESSNGSYTITLDVLRRAHAIRLGP
jgi:hypothetical protein